MIWITFVTIFATFVTPAEDRVELEACLEALARQRYPDFDVLVVDNASTEPVDEICHRHGAACIHEPVPGLTRARNRGARAARGELVAYIDDDAIPEPGWLEALVREFEDPAVAAVAGRARYMKAQGDTLRMSGEAAPDDIGPRPRRSFDRTASDWFALACFGGIGDGNSMAFRRYVLVNSVRFDERLGRGRLLDGGDEHVAFMSLIADGYRVNHAPEALVRHPAPATPELRRARQFRDRRASIAYVIFLWFEFPGYRADIARFLRKAVMKRVSGHARRPASLSRFEAVAAALGGVLVYWKARREWVCASQRHGGTADCAAPAFVRIPSPTR